MPKDNALEVTYYSMPAVRKLLAQKFGQVVCIQTVYNWAQRGVEVMGERVFLPTLLIANKRVTTEEWVREYLEVIGR